VENRSHVPRVVRAVAFWRCRDLPGAIGLGALAAPGEFRDGCTACAASLPPPEKRSRVALS
jgi:hypothetical protein